MKTTPFLVALALLCLFVNQTSWAQNPVLKENIQSFKKKYPDHTWKATFDSVVVKINKEAIKFHKIKKEKAIQKNLTHSTSSVSITNEGKVPYAVEYAALEALYNRTNGPNWIRSSGWLTGTTSPEMFEWLGVGGGVEIREDGAYSTNDVAFLQMSSNGLNGNIPPDLGDLSELEVLDLSSNNNLTGDIPKEIFTLKKLNHLNLSNTHLTGNLSTILEDLANLAVVDLSNTDINGNLSIALRNLENLFFLNLNSTNIDVNLAAAIEVLKERPSLMGLDLGSTNINEVLPTTIGNIKNLWFLNLSSNNISGEIPYEISTSEFRVLDLHDNKLSGSLPSELSQLQYLEEFYINDNRFSSSIPQGSSLKKLHIQNNFFTFSYIEPFFSGVDQHKLIDFQYAPQGIVGSASTLLFTEGDIFTLPYQTTATRNKYQWQKQIDGVWTDIDGATQKDYQVTYAQQNDAGVYRCVITNAWATQLTLYTNIFIVDVQAPYTPGQDEQAMYEFYDKIENKENLPASWDTNAPVDTWEGVTVQNGRVTKILLRNKGLQGSIPASFGDLTGLTDLDLGDNQFTGEIPTTFGRLTKLKALKLEKNELTGEIPATLGNLINLDFLYLNENQLSGSIPATLGNLSRLQVMNLGANRLSGSLPGELGNLGNLGHLFLGYNQFTGELPPNYTNLLKLQRLDLNGNQLSGQLPGWLGNLKNVYLLSLGGNQFSGAIPPAIGEMSSLRYLQLWKNQLSGSIPGELGKLQNLEYLHLYENQLSGSVPNELTYLYKLKEIRIHQNEFTCLPDFSRLSLLQRLEVTSNRLTFGCLIPNRNIPDFRYSPQKEVGFPQNIGISACQSYPLDLGFDYGISTNRYEWYRNNNSFFTNNTNSLLLDIQDIILNNLFGDYYVKVTNPLFPGFTLTTRKIVLTNNLTIPCENEQNNYNYVQAETILKKGYTNESSLKYLGNQERSVHYDYMDGLGRVMQQVNKGASPAGKDIILPVEYDAFGRAAKQFLPYATTAQSGDYRDDYATTQPAFYTATGDKVADTDDPYSETIFEKSPLNRVTEQGAPGTDWQPATPGDAANKTIKYAYRTNIANEVRMWNCQASSIESEAFYDVGQLYVTETKDEENRSVWEYKDKQDRVVLKKVAGVDASGADKDLLTYYVYDDFGNLRVVIPPKASATLSSTGTITKLFSDSFITQGCFAYDYDARQRMVSKQVPGAKPVWMVYDDRDRLILTQDGTQREDQQWIFTKYDALNRPVMTGMYTHDTDYQNDPSGMQSEMDTESFTENYTGSADNFGYSDTGFPTVINNSAVQLLSVTYYDNYGFVTDVSTQFGSTYNFQDVSAQNNKASYPTSHFERVKGQVTGGLTRVLNTSDWLSSVNYYDERYQLIQTISENYPQGADVITNEYDFTGKVRNTLRMHTSFAPYTATALKINQRYLYDHTGRKTHLYMKIDEEAEVLLASYQYNELGELVEKNLHQKIDGSFLQSIDYRYNERGWMTRINNNDLSNDGANNDDDSDLFGMQLHYQQSAGIGNTPQYNGNISAVTWTNQTGTAQQEGYAYAYDKLNRISKAAYKNISDNTKNGQYDVRGENSNAIRYDLNGNILRLSRYGSTLSKIDDLQYNYSDGSSVGNQLQWVTDHSTNAFGMKDGNTSGSDYGYDANGNLEKDLNKAITGIAYNHLNLPYEITFSNSNVIRYTYSAVGTKLKKEVIEAGKTAVTYYLNGIQYHTMHQGQVPIQLDFIASAEGSVIPFVPLQVEPCATVDITNLQSGPWVYQYNLTDHLGNTRLTLSSELITDTYLATMESDNAIDDAEETAFLNLSTYRSVQQAYNATEANGCTEITTPNEVAIVANTTDNMQVPAKSLAVQKGDQLYVEVKAQYLEQNTTNTQAIANMASAVMSSMGGGTGIETQGANKSSHEAAALGAAANSTTSTVPPAALITLVYDQDYNLIGNPIIQSITEEAKVTQENPDAPHETLSFNVLLDQPGYVYVYLWNPGTTLVYFDDFLVKHQHGEVVQADDFYPFGLALQKREDFENKYLYNGKELQDELGLDWYDYGARMYDAALGRWNHIDPLADSMKMFSPYNYAFNKPMTHIDPDGKAPYSPIYTPNGTFLGVDNQGFSGEPIIMSSFQYALAGGIVGSNYMISHATALEYGTPFNQYLFESGMTLKAYSNILTDITLKIPAVNFSFDQLHNSKISVAIADMMPYSKKLGFNDARPIGSSARSTRPAVANTGAPPRGESIVVTAALYGYFEGATYNKVNGKWKGVYNPTLQTVENIQSTLGIHEYFGHGILGIGGDELGHSRIYNIQLNHIQTYWGLTPQYKSHIYNGAAYK